MEIDVPRSLAFTVEEMKESEVEPAMAVLRESWLDTYPNADFGVTREWIEERHKWQLDPKRVEIRRKNFYDPNTAGWVAKDESGSIVGMALSYRDSEGQQHVGALYVDKDWHGKGVGSALMEQAIEWFDPTRPIELGVATYNHRARTFYQKLGFKEVSGSEGLFADTIPELKMVREATR